MKEFKRSQRVVSGRAGRPSTFTPEMAERIVAELADGRSLTAICTADQMPGRRTLLGWQERDADFRARCARAREAGADIAFDRMAQIEADLLDGKLDPAAGRAVLSSMQWRLSKLAPRRFGDRVQAELSGPDGGPVKVQRELSPLESARAVAFLLAMHQHNPLAIEGKAGADEID